MDARGTYIHYGNTKFDPNRGFPIKNSSRSYNKPKGGLWASPIDCEHSWKDWCEAEDFRECDDEDAFIFRLKPGATIMYINGEESAEQLYPYLFSEPSFLGSFHEGIDFEKLTRDGWDGLEINLRSLYCNRRLWDVFYGWDCDS